MAMNDQPQGRATDLMALAEAKFGKETLSDAEKLLLEKVPIGEWAICGPMHDRAVANGNPTKEDDDDPKNNPADADKWGPARQIRGELVKWLCLDHESRKHVHWQGIRVYGADVTGPLDLSLVSIPFQLAFRHCRLSGGIILAQAEVSQLDFQGSLVYGIFADRVNVKDYVALRYGFVAVGAVWLLGAQIGGDLDCDTGTFFNPPKPPTQDDPSSGIALNAQGIEVKGNVFLRGSSVRGEVRLVGAQIGGMLDCTGANPLKLEEGLPGSFALNAEQINVKGGVFLRVGFTADGAVNLYGARIGGPFDCRNGDFHKGTLDLTDASAASLLDSGLIGVTAVSHANSPGTDNPPSLASNYNPVVWPEAGNLSLDGFVYGRISGEERIEVAKRLEWLAKQPKMPFRPRPYLQLAKVLRESGDSDGALQVLEKMEELRRRSENNAPFAQIWSLFLKKSIGYGYRPGRAIWLIIFLSLLGWLVYGTSYRARTMVPTEKEAYKQFKYLATEGQVPAHYPTFSAPVYSLENSLPLVKLGQADKWQPAPAPDGWAWVRWFLRGQILLGWLLATLFVAGVSGIVHKE
jgi:hypothetical protein